MAGKGTRFLPATKAVAKEVFPIFNKPTLLYQLSEIYRSGVRRVAIVISKEKEHLVKNFLSHNVELEKSLKGTEKIHLLDELNEIIDNVEISYIYQGEMGGSGGAIYSLKEWAQNKPFGILFGDDLCYNEEKPVIGQLIKAYEKTGLNFTACTEKPIEVVPIYSSTIVNKKLFDRCYLIDGIIEKPKNPPTNLISLARYIVNPEIFDVLEKTPPVNGEVWLADALNTLAKQGKVGCYNFDGIYYDCGNKLEFLKCCIDMALKDDSVNKGLLEYMKTVLNKK